MKKALSLTLAFALSLALAVPAMAEESKWNLQVAGKSDEEVLLGEKTFTVRNWTWSYHDDNEIVTKTDGLEATISNIIMLKKGETAVFTNGGKEFGGLGLTVWSDPDGDGVYDNRLMREYYDNDGYMTWEIPPADIAGPLTSVDAAGDDQWYRNDFFIQGEGGIGNSDIVFGPTTELKQSADELLELFGANTLLWISVSEEEGWYILLEGNAAEPTTPAQPEEPAIPKTGTAYASTQDVLVDGKAVEFQMYALKDEKGYYTNYIKLRDLAQILNGTSAQFQVGWNGAVNIETGKAYTSNGSEMSTPFQGDRAYEAAAAATNINGRAADLTAFILKDSSGSGYTYYKLRDLGEALGFNVSWSREKGVFVETDKPYTAD